MTPTFSPYVELDPNDAFEPKFDAARFALCSTLDSLSREQSAEFQREWDRGRSLAERKLRRISYFKHGDVEAGAKDVIAEIVGKLRRTVQRAQLKRPVEGLDAAALVARLRQDLKLWRLAKDDQKKRDLGLVPDMLICLRAIEMRGATMSFVAKIDRVSTMNSAVILKANKALNGYAITMVLNECTSLLRDASRTEGRSDEDLETMVSPVDHGELWLRRKGDGGGAIRHPFRAIVKVAQDKAKKRIEACQRTDANWLAARPFLKAWVEVFPLILETPGVPTRTYARGVLEAQGFSEAEINRGLAAALRHPIIEDLHSQIAEGFRWHLSSELRRH